MEWCKGPDATLAPRATLAKGWLFLGALGGFVGQVEAGSSGFDFLVDA